MARKRISEYRAKKLLSGVLDQQYTGVQATVSQPLTPISLDREYIVKVDQGVKGRFKKGLILLNQREQSLTQAMTTLAERGYSQFLIEEQVSYDQSDERYLSIERTREGYTILFSKTGGIHIEQNQQTIQSITLPYSLTDDEIKTFLSKNSSSEVLRQILPIDTLMKLLLAFDTYFMSFLEINPFIVINDQILLLDAAVEVDSTAEFFVDGKWTEKDFAHGSKEKSQEEKNVADLAANSQAAFSLEILNPNGSIWMLLSGGGASIVLADEVYNQGHGKNLANYGEYSGNPKTEETYIYTQNLLRLLLKSTAQKKVLIIAGGVANFTDVRKTFQGLILALDEVKNALQEQHITIFVRRGGPYQDEGLALMKAFLEKNNLLGMVEGPDMILTDIVTQAVQQL